MYAVIRTGGKQYRVAPGDVQQYGRSLGQEHQLLIKQFRAIATRYEKTARNFLAAVQLVASVVWLN